MLHTYTCLHIKHTTLPCSRKIRAQRRSPELSGNWPDQWGETMAMSLGDQLLHKLQGLRKIWHYNLRSGIYCMNWSDLTVFMDAMERCSGWNLSLAKRLKQSFGVGNQLQNFQQHQAWLSSVWLCLPCPDLRMQSSLRTQLAEVASIGGDISMITPSFCRLRLVACSLLSQESGMKGIITWCLAYIHH